MASSCYKAEVYLGPPIKQKLRHKNKLIGCTETSFAVVVNDATFGGCVVTELDVRKLSGEWPIADDNDSPGLNQDQLERAARALHIEYTNMTGESFATLRKAIVYGNRKCVIQLDDPLFAAVPHAVAAERVDGKEWLVMNPLTGKRSWVNEADVKRGMERLASDEGIQGLFWGQTKTLPKKAVK